MAETYTQTALLHHNPIMDQLLTANPSPVFLQDLLCAKNLNFCCDFVIERISECGTQLLWVSASRGKQIPKEMCALKVVRIYPSRTGQYLHIYTENAPKAIVPENHRIAIRDLIAVLGSNVLYKVDHNSKNKPRLSSLVAPALVSDETQPLAEIELLQDCKEHNIVVLKTRKTVPSDIQYLS